MKATGEAGWGRAWVGSERREGEGGWVVVRASVGGDEAEGFVFARWLLEETGIVSSHGSREK